MPSESSSLGLSVSGSNHGPGTFNQYNLSPDDERRELSKAASKLHARVAVAAMHNSEHQGADAPRCHPNTRELVQQKIYSRLSHPGAEGGHIWLTGPAGTGKTAIVGSVCERFHKEGRLAASFYFSSHKSSGNRRSKKHFVTTLAHQFQNHRDLNEHISMSMLSTIRLQPDILDMILAEQANSLILQPFRNSKTLDSSTFDSPWILAVDGIDECEENTDPGYNQSRQKDQLEILRVLLALADDPSFPCRIIIGSRPETWIRTFFEDEAIGRFTEMFLGEQYDPDNDIRSYYQSYFSRISLRHGYVPSEWPTNQDLAKLVEAASGQFIYASTVIRFVDSEWPLPKGQLELVLDVKSPVAGSNPLDTLDELYTTIIKKSSPCPDITTTWLQGICIVKRLISRWESLSMPFWDFIDSLFEHSESEARTVLALPSLISAKYEFYHKSFIDYLEDTARCGIAFPAIDRFKVDQWLVDRISKILERSGPRKPFETPIQTYWFGVGFREIWFEHMAPRYKRLVISQDILAQSRPEIWLQSSLHFGYHPEAILEFVAFVYIFVHSECRFHRRCGAGCRRWRRFIMGDPQSRQIVTNRWTPHALLLDTVCIKRIPCPRPTHSGGR